MTPPSRPFLLDTNILVHAARKSALWVRIDAELNLAVNRHASLISVVTVVEVYSLARQLAWGHEKKSRLDGLLSEIITIDINYPEVLEKYGELDDWLRRQGRKLCKNDIWIAATASVSDALLLSTDKDFEALAAAAHLKLLWIDPTKM